MRLDLFTFLISPPYIFVSYSSLKALFSNFILADALEDAQEDASADSVAD